MTTTTRLASVSSRLTITERALLALRYYLHDEDPDADTLRIIGHDDPGVRRIADAVREANTHFYQALSYCVEWLYQEEIQLGWLRCLDAMLERDATLREALRLAGWKVVEAETPSVDARAKRAVLRPLPTPGQGLTRTLPIFWGARAYPDDETEPVDVGSLRDALATGLRRSVELRWRDCVAHRTVLAEMAEAMGQPVTHIKLEDVLSLVEAKVLELYEGLARRGERFPLPTDGGRQLEILHDWV